MYEAMNTAAPLLLFLLQCVSTDAVIMPDEGPPPLLVDGVVGLPVLLPCPTQPNKPGDKIVMVLIYKDDQPKPIYSCDTRPSSSLTNCIQWMDPSIKGRAKFWNIPGSNSSSNQLHGYRYNPHAKPFFESPNKRPSLSGFVLKPTLKADNGTYVCRVDFKSSPTLNNILKLRVVAPISSLTVKGFTPGAMHDVDAEQPPRMTAEGNTKQGLSGSVKTSTGRKVALGVVRGIGMYVAGDELILQCEAIGGYPAPTLEWVEDRETLPPSSKTGRKYRSSSIYRIPSLGAEDVGRVISCVGENSPITPPLVDTVRIQLTVPPVRVDLFLVDTPSTSPPNLQELSLLPRVSNGSTIRVREGQSFQLVCSSDGTRPAASLLWTMGGDDPIPAHLVQTESRESESSPHLSHTVSTVSLRASPLLHFSEVHCRATVPTLPHTPSTFTVNLEVISSPQVTIKSSTSSATVNSTVTLSCGITAYPSLLGNIHFHRNDKIISSSPASQDYSQRLTSRVLLIGPESAGQYSCSAENTQGRSYSAPIHVAVEYVPQCLPSSTTTFNSRSSEVISIPCSVQANPLPTVFRWYTSSLNRNEPPVLIRESVTPNEASNHTSAATSTLTYRVPQQPPYPLILCFAENAVGKMDTPCAFKINSADKPSPVKNCDIQEEASNDLRGLVSISCIPGHDGGLNQSFTLEILPVSNLDARLPKSLYMSSTPYFMVSSLCANEDYTLTVTSTNARGLSSPFTLIYSMPTYKSSELSTLVLSEEVTPVLVVILGAMVIVIIVSVTVLIIRHMIKKKDLEREVTANKSAITSDRKYTKLRKCHHQHKFAQGVHYGNMFHLCGTHSKLPSSPMKGCISATRSLHGESCCSSFYGDSLSRASTCRSTTETFLWSQSNSDSESQQTFRNSGCYHIENLTPPECVYVSRQLHGEEEFDKYSLEGSNMELQMINNHKNHLLNRNNEQYNPSTICSRDSVSFHLKDLRRSQHEEESEIFTEVPVPSSKPPSLDLPRSVGDDISCVSSNNSSRPGSTISTVTVTLNPNYSEVVDSTSNGETLIGDEPCIPCNETNSSFRIERD